MCLNAWFARNKSENNANCLRCKMRVDTGEVDAREGVKQKGVSVCEGVAAEGVGGGGGKVPHHQGTLQDLQPVILRREPEPIATLVTMGGS